MDELTARAIATYLRDNPGVAAPHPFSGPQMVGKFQYVVLRDGMAQVIAVYRVKQHPDRPGAYLRRLRQWPAALNPVVGP